MAHEKTMQLDGVDIVVEKDAEGNITAEPVAPQSMPELVDEARDVVDGRTDVEANNGKIIVETPIYTDELIELKELGLSLSYIRRSGRAVFVHDRLGKSDYCHSYGSDASDVL